VEIRCVAASLLKTLSAMTMEQLAVTAADSGTSLRLEEPSIAEQLKMRLAVALAKRSQKWQ
tara:strand:- start:2109 stop:2291 length:183 start_codon:yes stop_codon:yes gene_type:complete